MNLKYSMDPNQGSSSFFSSFNFQRIVIFIAIIMLIVALVFIGYALYKQSSDVTWPPKIPKCPDYWTVDPTATSTNGCRPPPAPIPACEYNGIPAVVSGYGGKKLPGCP